MNSGNGTNSFDIYIFGNTASDQIVFDASDNDMAYDGIDLQLEDGDFLRFGDLTAGDITMNFDGTNFEIEGAAAATTVLIGATSHLLNITLTGTLTVGVNDIGHDVKFFGATAGAYCLWDEDVDDLILVGGAGLVIGAAAIGITFNGACTTACISMDGATLENGDHEIEMRNTVSGDKTVICAGTATDDAGIVTAVGADADIADGSLYLSATDGGGKLFVKVSDVWKQLQVVT